MGASLRFQRKWAKKKRRTTYGRLKAVGGGGREVEQSDAHFLPNAKAESDHKGSCPNNVVNNEIPKRTWKKHEKRSGTDRVSTGRFCNEVIR
ncbi:hypothetical protein NEUTE2DRAFT_144142, partial [Neurospora tetrasperma FGSC 2509]